MSAASTWRVSFHACSCWRLGDIGLVWLVLACMGLMVWFVSVPDRLVCAWWVVEWGNAGAIWGEDWGNVVGVCARSG
eukprot:2156805-Rhodomonas_salina.1